MSHPVQMFPNLEFFCSDSVRFSWIFQAWKCDGDPDCGEFDNTDEDKEQCRESHGL